MSFEEKIQRQREFDFATWGALEGFVNDELMPWCHELTEKPDLPVNKELVPLFRGQADSEWRLETTLERFCAGKEISVAEYFQKLRDIKPSLESFSGIRWNLPDETKIELHGPLPDLEYEFMAHLRHIGFPSPLLDWTRSYQIAAYMAFREKLAECVKRDKPPERAKASPIEKRTAIWVHVPDTGAGRSSGKPCILDLGPKVTTHPRHFLQQAQYTMGLRKKDGHWVYAPMHEFFVDRNRPVSHGHLILKLTLPVSERTKVLKKLNGMNINEYSLMPSEDSLARALANEHFLFR